jgi:hypothetical protein
MDLEKIIPIIEQTFQNALAQKRYAFGFDRYKGVSNKIATGSLRNSIQVKAKGKDEITISMNDYGQWVQSGRAPGKGKVPISAIISWIKARKLKGRDKKGRYIKDISFAFGIQTNIKKFGIRKSDWYDVAIEELFENKQIEELLGDASIEDLINALEGI